MTQEYALTIQEVIQRTPSVKSFRLESREDISYQAGQFLVVRLHAGSELKRYLSLSSSPTEKGYLEFTKKITDSEFSQALDRLQRGDRLFIQYPFGTFTWAAAGQAEKVAFISGGIGITPIRSMCRFAAHKQLKREIVLLYANRSEEEIAFKDDFEQMQREFHLLKVVHVLCEPSRAISCKTGTVTRDIIAESVADYPQRTFFLCGPPGMVEAMKKILKDELSIGDEKIVTENFVGY